ADFKVSVNRLLRMIARKSVKNTWKSCALCGFFVYRFGCGCDRAMENVLASGRSAVASKAHAFHGQLSRECLPAGKKRNTTRTVSCSSSEEIGSRHQGH
ncbi:MAG: hypothetical protein ONB49_17755, partial [candidate division KSB1 bacterium]|nr:hypothetical protein [candidate division KSB1 bacterium]